MTDRCVTHIYELYTAPTRHTHTTLKSDADDLTL